MKSGTGVVPSGASSKLYFEYLKIISKKTADEEICVVGHKVVHSGGRSQNHVPR